MMRKTSPLYQSGVSDKDIQEKYQRTLVLVEFTIRRILYPSRIGEDLELVICLKNDMQLSDREMKITSIENFPKSDCSYEI